LKSLDQLIEKIEEQAQKQNQNNNQSDQGQQANKPADDSRILKQKAPGNIDRRDFNSEGQWGDLPPHEREEALLRIEKGFPAHYRDIIEQYFREMAGKQE
jgi:acyl-CoA reductase-like NAD-dependent aldehyde dehydrogenase